METSKKVSTLWCGKVMIGGPDLTVDSTIFELWVALRASQTQQLDPDGRIRVSSVNLNT